MLKLFEQLKNNMTQEERDALEAKRLARQNDPMRRAFNIMLDNQRRQADALEQQAASTTSTRTPKLT